MPLLSLAFKMEKNVITIAYLNVRGLGNNTRRRETFSWLCLKHFSIYLLQEVHCSEKTKDLWATEWGYKCLFSTTSSAKVGIGVLFNNNFELQIMKNYIDPAGHYIICDLVANGKLVTLVNVYAPNEGDPNFFKALAEHIEDFQKDETVIGGDFNLVLDIRERQERRPPQNKQQCKKNGVRDCQTI